MDTDNVTVLTAAVLAAAVAIAVPWLAFRYALRQEHARWLREQRAVLYADLLVEVLAEQEWCQHAMTNEPARAIAPFEDMRLPRLERARLGARGTSLGSRSVNQLFNEAGATIGRIHMAHALAQVDEEAAQMQLRVEGGRAFDRLEAEIRRELDTDRTPARLGRRR